MERYAAKLMFQFRVDKGRGTPKRRMCEERIVLIDARSARDALSKARRKGSRAEHHYDTAFGNTVYFEFIGVMELLALGAECEPDEVWYELVDRHSPLERRDAFIPDEHELNAIRNEIHSVNPVGNRAGKTSDRPTASCKVTQVSKRRNGRSS
jgi:hypothetical protein